MACASLASVTVAPTRLWFGKFLNWPRPTPKKGDRRWSLQGSLCSDRCQKLVPENTPCTWPRSASTDSVSDSLTLVQSLSIGSDLKRPQAPPNLHAPAQVVVQDDVAKGLAAAGIGQRGLELTAVDPAELAGFGAHLVPVGVAQFDHHRLAARDDEEHRVAAARAGAHFQKGVGDGQAFAAWLRAAGACA